MGRPLDAEDLDRIEIERVHRDDAGAQCICEVGPKKKRIKINTAAVRITITGTDGSVITDIWTRDQFWMFCRQASQMLTDG